MNAVDALSHPPVTSVMTDTKGGADSQKTIDIEALKEEIKKIEDKHKRKEAYEKYKHLLTQNTQPQSKGLSKSERREQQELQRERKQNQRKDGNTEKATKTNKSVDKPMEAPQKQALKQATQSNVARPTSTSTKNLRHVNFAIYQCGLWMKAYKIIGSNARVRATLLALKFWLKGLAETSDENTVFSHENFAGTNKPLSFQLSYLEDCRKKSIGMGNAIRLLKECSFRVSQERLSEPSAFRRLAEFTDLIRTEKVDYAVEKIAEHGIRRIYENDIIATFGHSESISKALRQAAKTKHFTVIIIDTPPLYEGLILLRELQSHPNIKIRYSLISSITTALNDATKLFLGASAVLSNGDLLGRAGTAAVATLTRNFRVPVIVFSETYKFTQKVWIGSLTDNEEYQDSSDQRSYMYDLTPVRMLDVIMTEYGPLPPCNVCTLIRDKSDVSF